MDPNVIPADSTTRPGWLRTTWDSAAEGLNAAVNSIRQRYETPPALSLPGHEPAAGEGPMAKVYRLIDPPRSLFGVGDPTSCGPGSSAVARPWDNIPANYSVPSQLPATSLEGVVRSLQSQGVPLKPGDVVSFPGKGLHVFEPSQYLQHLATPGAPTLWHNLAMPVAVAGGTLVAIAAVKYLTTPDEQPKTTIEVEHGR